MVSAMQLQEKNDTENLMLSVESQTPIMAMRFCCKILILPYSTEWKLRKVVNNQKFQ
jgi:hypothetical protein